MAIKKKIIIGWEEWCALPDLGLPAIKAKIDTGAKTSALHAYDIKTFKEGGVDKVQFKITPLQRKKQIEKTCTATLIENRVVISSNGEREKRYVIITPITIGEITFESEVTLTSRHKMSFMMLLGREALRKAKVNVDPRKSYMLGKVKNAEEQYKLIEDV